MSRDTANINDQLGEDPDVFPLLNANYNEEPRIEEGALIISTNTIGDSFIFGHPDNGKFGTSTFGSTARVLTVAKVINKDNLHKEKFRYDIFKDATNTTATWDTTNTQLSFLLNQSAYSLAVYKEATTATQAIIYPTVSSGTFTYYLSANGGSNWENVTANTLHTFTNQGTEMRWRTDSLTCPEEIIDNCNATTGWTDSANATTSLNTTTYKTGTGAINIAKDGTTTTFCSTYKTTTSLNFVNKYLYFWLYIKDATMYAKLNATDAWYGRFGSTSTAYYGYSRDKSQLAIGWNQIGPFTIANAESTTGTPDTANMDYTLIGINGAATSTVWSAGDVIFDDIKLVTPSVITQVNVQYYM